MTALDSTFQRGLALHQQARFADAARVYARVLRRQPRHFAALHLSGVIALQTGRREEGISLIGKALALDPSVAAAHGNLGIGLAALGRAEDAIASFDRAIALDPAYGQALHLRGIALASLERYDEALMSYDRTVAVDPGTAEAYYNRGNTLIALDRTADAIADYDRALTLAPDHAGTHYNRGNALRSLQRYEEAIVSYDRAIAIQPDYAEARSNQALCRLALGDYPHGFRQFEWRWRAELAHARPDLPGAPWLGETPLAARTLLVVAEQGLGDSIHFCRYVAHLAPARVVVEVPPPLTRLLSDLPGASAVIASGEPRPAFDCWTPMMSLPLALGTRLESVPAAVPYLAADPALALRWRDRLAELPGLRVGLVWAGSTQLGNHRSVPLDRRRSITLAHYAPLAAIPGVSFVSLQKGPPASHAAMPPAGMTLHDWTTELDDFADTAALIDNLDLVISIDTSVVHLAGAMARPVWVLSRFDQCWRWLRGRSDSPWYPTVRLFQQRSPGDWSSVLAAVASALGTTAAEGQAPERSAATTRVMTSAQTPGTR